MLVSPLYGNLDRELHCFFVVVVFYARSRLRFSSSKIAPTLNITEAHEKILYCLQEGNVVRSSHRTPGINSWNVDLAVKHLRHPPKSERTYVAS